MRRSLVPILFAKPGWVLPGATLDMDFANNRAWRKGNGLSLPASLLTTTRASTGYAANSSGLLVPFLSNIPRITDLGLLVEQAATNSIRNSSGTGAVIGSPGTLPTNWADNSSGLTHSIIGTGTEFGLPYVDIRMQGTPSATTEAISFAPEGNSGTTIAAANGQTWSSSFYARLVGGTNTNIAGFKVQVIGRSVGGSGLESSNGVRSALTSSLQRFTVTRTLNNASTVFVDTKLLADASDTVTAIDITIRFYVPQLEQSPVATSPIPTTTVAVTRAIDNEAAATTLLTALQSASGTVIMSVGGGIAAAVGTILGINALIGLGKTAADKLTTAFGGAQTSGNTATWTGNNKIGLRWSATAVAICLNGGTIVTAANTPPAVTSANIGSTSGSSAAVNQFIKRLTVFTSSVSDASLQVLTT